MKPFNFHREARQELLYQAQFYEDRSEGLGVRFLEQVASAIKLAASMPRTGIPYKHETRRVFPKDFPFSIVYRESSEQLTILAVAAFKRKPGYWRER